MQAAVSHPVLHPLSGTVTVPGDKSISHRALMFSALGHGTTRISGLLQGADVIATARALRSMGVQIDQDPDRIWYVTGIGDGKLEAHKAPLDMGNSGTSARLLMGMMTGYPLRVTLTGDASLSKRPMARVTTPLQQMGGVFSDTHLPIVMQGRKSLTPITYTLPVASAQVKSAILLAGLRANGTTTVIESVPTRDHTERMLQAMGANINITRRGDRQEISIKGFPDLKNIPEIDVPSDPSSAAFLTVAALIVPGSDILLTNILMNKTRTGLYDTLIEMGADIDIINQRTVGGEDVADLHVRHSRLRGITVPPTRVASMIDEFPILSIAASFAEGDTHMSDLAELRVKESDRLLMMHQGLAAAGVATQMGEDWLTITGMERVPGGCMIATHFDHRIAMSFLVLGMAAKAAITIDDTHAIATSFPDFMPLMNRLGADIR